MEKSLEDGLYQAVLTQDHQTVAHLLSKGKVFGVGKLWTIFINLGWCGLCLLVYYALSHNYSTKFI